MPAVSRHIAFFILLYLDFILVFIALRLIFIPWSEYRLSSSSTLYLSVTFIAVYLVIFGIYMGSKAAVNSVKNKKLEYVKQFKDPE